MLKPSRCFLQGEGANRGLLWSIVLEHQTEHQTSLTYMSDVCWWPEFKECKYRPGSQWNDADRFITTCNCWLYHLSSLSLHHHKSHHLILPPAACHPALNWGCVGWGRSIVNSLLTVRKPLETVDNWHFSPPGPQTGDFCNKYPYVEQSLTPGDECR